MGLARRRGEVAPQPLLGRGPQCPSSPSPLSLLYRHHVLPYHVPDVGAGSLTVPLPPSPPLPCATIRAVCAPRSHSTWVLVDPPMHVPLPCATIRAVGAQVAQHMGAGAVRLIVEARLSGEQAYGQVLAVIAHPVLGLRV